MAISNKAKNAKTLKKIENFPLEKYKANLNLDTSFLTKWAYWCSTNSTTPEQIAKAITSQKVDHLAISMLFWYLHDIEVYTGEWYKKVKKFEEVDDDYSQYFTPSPGKGLLKFIEAIEALGYNFKRRKKDNRLILKLTKKDFERAYYTNLASGTSQSDEEASIRYQKQEEYDSKPGKRDSSYENWTKKRLFRGMPTTTFTPEELISLCKKGIQLETGRVASATVSESEASKFGGTRGISGVLFDISNPSNIGTFVDNYSQNEGEAEVLISGFFQVTGFSFTDLQPNDDVMPANVTDEYSLTGSTFKIENDFEKLKMYILLKKHMGYGTTTFNYALTLYCTLVPRPKGVEPSNPYE